VTYRYGTYHHFNGLESIVGLRSTHIVVDNRSHLFHNLRHLSGGFCTATILYCMETEAHV